MNQFFGFVRQRTWTQTPHFSSNITKVKKRKLRTILKEAEMVFDKIQNLVMINSCSKIGMKENLFTLRIHSTKTLTKSYLMVKMKYFTMISKTKK